MVARINMGLEPSGRELLAVVIKGTFVLPRRGEQVVLHEVQLPLTMVAHMANDEGQRVAIVLPYRTHK